MEKVFDIYLIFKHSNFIIQNYHLFNFQTKMSFSQITISYM